MEILYVGCTEILARGVEHIGSKHVEGNIIGIN
jgi:hypothetical protein